jgi:hypothetical protein
VESFAPSGVPGVVEQGIDGSRVGDVRRRRTPTTTGSNQQDDCHALQIPSSHAIPLCRHLSLRSLIRRQSTEIRAWTSAPDPPGPPSAPPVRVQLRRDGGTFRARSREHDELPQGASGRAPRVRPGCVAEVPPTRAGSSRASRSSPSRGSTRRTTACCVRYYATRFDDTILSTSR